jgi:hypothetical protein
MDKIIFESIIKTNPVGRWYIEIRDTSDEESQMCLDIDEYAVKVENMGAKHGGNIEIHWSQEENVTPEQINEVRIAMMDYEAQLEREKEEFANASHNVDGSPKF